MAADTKAPLFSDESVAKRRGRKPAETSVTAIGASNAASCSSLCYAAGQPDNLGRGSINRCRGHKLVGLMETRADGPPKVSSGGESAQQANVQTVSSCRHRRNLKTYVRNGEPLALFAVS